MHLSTLSPPFFRYIDTALPFLRRNIDQPSGPALGEEDIGLVVGSSIVFKIMEQVVVRLRF